MKVAVVSDTHGPRFWKSCPPRVAVHLTDADVILHAGDVCTAIVLDELMQFAPVYAVIGNNDGPDVAQWGAQEVLELSLDGVDFAMIHNSGSSVGRMKRMQKSFPNAQCVVFGHSHIPMNEVDPITGFRIFNPGSPVDKRRQPHKTMGMITIQDAVITDAQIVVVD